MRGQLNEMKSGGKDTHDLAVAAGKQADAAKTQSEQAKAQTEKMGAALGKTDGFIEQTATQARATNTIATSAENLFISTQRAYVTVNGLEIQPVLDAGGQQKYWNVWPILVNSDNTPTKNLVWAKMATDWDFEYDPNSKRAVRQLNILQVTLNPLALAAHQEIRNMHAFADVVPVEYADKVRAQMIRPYIHGVLVYDDFVSNRPHVTRYCYFL